MAISAHFSKIVRQIKTELTSFAALAAASAQAWAEGTFPGGIGTKSSKEWSADAQALAEFIAVLGLGAIYDTVPEGVAPDTGVANGEFFLVWENERLPIYVNSAGVALKKAELPTTALSLSPIYSDLASSAAGKGGSLVAFLQSGTGAVSRTTQAKLRDTVTVEDYGAVGDNIADDTVAIQKMIDDRGYFRLLAKTYKITDTIKVPSHAQNIKAIGSLWSGEGMELSILNCVGMAGKAAIAGDGAGYYRLIMRDFGVIGDADQAIKFTTSHAFYQSKFENLILRSQAGTAFECLEHFSTSWDNVQVWSFGTPGVPLSGGHGFHIEGGNSTVMTNCYVHTLNKGNGKCGYRIRSSATLIACNGVDAGDVWGIFGDVAGYEAGSSNATFQIRLIGCNIEDFDTYAIGLMFTGAITFDGTFFVAKASGTYETLLKGNLSGNISQWRLTERGSGFVTKGSTQSGPAPVLGGSSNGIDVTEPGPFSGGFYHTGVSLLYPMPVSSLTGPAYQVLARKFTALDADRFYGFTHQPPTVWTADATTFSVASRNVIKTGNTAATAFATATGGSEGQELTLLIRDAFTTINHGTGANAFNLKGAANLVCANGDVLKFVHNGTGWKQI